MKMDLHVHTRFSKRPANWFLKKLGCPESFTDPVACHALLKRAGMTHVTFTDHNTIDGCLHVAHLPDTFISEEITAYFPEDRCKIHVLAYGLSEAQHREIQDVRENIFELVPYLRTQGIAHALAHPFSAVNDRFDLAHFEKLLLLFRMFELNGDQETSVNAMLRRVIESLTERGLARLADRHGLPPAMAASWRKAFVAGSDDHAGTAVGASNTRVGGAQNLAEFFLGVEDGRASLAVHGSAPQAFGRNIYSVAYRYFKDRFGLAGHSGKDALLRFLDAMLDPERPRSYGLLSNLSYAIDRRRTPKDPHESDSLMDFLRYRAALLVREQPDLATLLEQDAPPSGDDGQQWYHFVDRVTNETMAHLAARFSKRFANGDFFDLFHSIGSAGAIYAMLAPYFVAYPFHAAERRLAATIGAAFLPAAGEPMRVARFVDSPGEDPGPMPETMHVRETLRLKVITCLPEGCDIPGVTCFEPVAVQELPECGGLRLPMPPFLQMLDYCYDTGFDRIHIASPGPCGFAALGVARLLGVPITIEFSEVFKAVMEAVGPASGMEAAMWHFAAWFANQTEAVYVFSAADAETLVGHGFDRKRIVCLDAPAEGPERTDALLRHWQGGAVASPARAPLGEDPFGLPLSAVFSTPPASAEQDPQRSARMTAAPEVQ